MTELRVERVMLRFDDSWQVAKWDDSRWYRARIERLQGELDGKHESTKAMDVVGIRDEVPYLFEVKDFRGYPIENKARQVRELPLGSVSLPSGRVNRPVRRTSPIAAAWMA